MAAPKTKRTKKGGEALHAEVKGPAGSKYLVVSLNEGKTVLADPGSMIYLQGKVEKAMVSLQGVGKAFARAFGGQDFVMTTFTGAQGGGKVAFSSDIPSDIIAIPIEPGKSIMISRGSFLCCTSNVTISGTFRWRGLIPVGQDEGFVLPVASCKDGTGPGMIWLSAYGTFQKISLAQDETLLVDNGVFLACDNNVNYELANLNKGILSTLFSSEGFGIQFKGPCTVFIQSKNIQDLIHFIQMNGGQSFTQNVKEELGKNVAQSLIGSIFGNHGSEGGSKRRNGKK